MTAKEFVKKHCPTAYAEKLESQNIKGKKKAIGW
jgi:hypothetical protein